MVKVGDRLVVQRMSFPAYVEKIEFDATIQRTVLYLDWKGHGKSRVYLDDQNKVWHLLSDDN
jgi:hypothetical protein